MVDLRPGQRDSNLGNSEYKPTALLQHQSAAGYVDLEQNLWYGEMMEY
jgi:hypothetical protein